MSDDDHHDVEEVYNFQGNNEGEEQQEDVPKTIEKLIVDEGIRVLPDRMCFSCKRLREVTLPKKHLFKIGSRAFAVCTNLLEISIGNTVQFIGARAFSDCYLLSKVEFDEFSTSLPPHQQLQSIDKAAFSLCSSLARIKLPSTLNFIGQSAFASCHSLMEANLSTTCIREISCWTFACCQSLQTVGFPNTLEQIAGQAFCLCPQLVTVVVPHDSSSPIRIGQLCFQECHSLANLLLPQDSTAKEDSFTGCGQLHELYGQDSSRIVAGLIGRFDGFLIHKMCYGDSVVTVQELRQQCIASQQEEQKCLLVDQFGMTPFHLLLSSMEPSIELLEVLLDSLPNQILRLKDVNEKRPLDYLIYNWTDGTKSLLQRTFQKWTIDPLARWGATSWMETMKTKVQAILSQDDVEQRENLYNEAYSALQHYENVESTSILEMALWKEKLKSGWTNGGTKRQALDREECRCLSGSDVVIPHIAIMLGISQRTST